MTSTDVRPAQPLGAASAPPQFIGPDRPLEMRIFNAVGNQFRRWKWERPLSVDPILNVAQRITQLKDFGSEEFLEPLQRLTGRIIRRASAQVRHLSPHEARTRRCNL